MRKFGILLAMLVSLLGLYACGGGGGSGPNDVFVPQTPAGGGQPPSNLPPATMSLTSNLPAGSLLSQGGQATVSATILDSNGAPVANGTVVTFTSSAGSITTTSTTTNGTATATFQAGNSAGIVTITAAAGDATDSMTIQIAAGSAATITLDGVTPEKIGVKGSGIAESATITFVILDNGGNFVNDGTTVNFNLSPPLGGGESLAPASNSTASGKVSTTIKSGTVSGIASVIASVTVSGTTVSTEARVTIAAGKPDSNGFGLASEKIYLAGYDTYGLTSKVTAFLRDRYSNPVPMGTPVYFATESGIMALNDVTGNSTNLTNGFGQATATWQTAAPTPDTVSTVTNTIGINRIIAFTEGHESFVDNNGNGSYDLGEPFQDLGEPFIDANDNGVWDNAPTVTDEERFIDANSNGVYDGPNGQRDQNVLIWTSMLTVFSDGLPVITMSPGSFAVPDGGAVDITVTVEDQNGNSLPEGSSLSATVDKGRLLGEVSFKYPIIGPLSPRTTFLYRIEDREPGDTNGPESAEFKITVTSPIGDKVQSIFGSVN